MYASSEFQQLADDAIALLDRLTDGKPEAELARLEDVIVKTSYFEYMFWEMTEEVEMWPVAGVKAK